MQIQNECVNGAHYVCAHNYACTQELRRSAISRAVDVDEIEKGVKQSIAAVEVSEPFAKVFLSVLGCCYSLISIKSPKCLTTVLLTKPTYQ